MLANLLTGLPRRALMRTVPGGFALPAWFAGLAINEWVEIAGTSLSSHSTMAAPRGSNAPQGKQDAWCGWHIDTRNSRVYSVGQGGHDDYWGNEVNSIDLLDNTPTWTQRVTPTATGDVTASGDYYADGKPASVHGYHTSIFIESLDRALRFYGASPSKNGGASGVVTAYNASTGAYDASTVWNPLGSPQAIGAGEGAYAKHPDTEDVYCLMYNSVLTRWNKGVPGSFTTLIASPGNPAAYYSAAACDPTRNVIFFLGGGAGGDMSRRYDIPGNSLSTITLTGTDISGNDGIGLIYVLATDRYYAFIPSASGSAVYVITPTTGTSWNCSLLSTTGGSALPDTSSNSAYHPWTKFLYVPQLSGAVFGPRWGSNLWFLRLH